ncbi:hypothetical protein FQR65_LT00488 [Abscondita terminalis]|nr:hypothetical protein FQR65_LT00488 [Abscondita terminalis]
METLSADGKHLKGIGNEEESHPLHNHRMIVAVAKFEEYAAIKHPTSYGHTLMHLTKLNIGAGIFAMGNAFKNSGLILGSILVPLLGLICAHCVHLLVKILTSDIFSFRLHFSLGKRVGHVKDNLNLTKNPNYAMTAEMSFAIGPSRIKNFAPHMKKIVVTFLCSTQVGFCCVYVVFISRNTKQIMDYFGFEYSIQLHMVFILFPITLCCLVRNLKYLTPLSVLANVCMLYGITITLYYSCQKPFSNVENFAHVKQLPLFFGTALYAFEGIGSELPLRNEMKNPKQFSRPFGVLNVGLTTVVVFFCLIGISTYLHYGNAILGSATLNLPKDESLALSVKIVIPLGVLLTFAIQFYIPISVIFPYLRERFGPFNRPAVAECVFRVCFVLVIFALAAIIPYLELFISLVGALCSTSIALIIPPILELVTKSSKITVWMIIKNVVIISMGLLGCVTGSYESIRLIIEAVKNDSS